MKSIEEYIGLAAKKGHTRSGIILGVRMALLGLKELGIENPSEHHHRLVIVVETDRCLPDAVELVTGCRLGNRTLKFRDMGKMAATFADIKKHCAVRLAAKDISSRYALELSPTPGKEEALEMACRTLPDRELFTRQTVRVRLASEDIPGYHAPRVACAECGEGIAFGKEVTEAGRALCRSCAGQTYFELV